MKLSAFPGLVASEYIEKCHSRYKLRAEISTDAYHWKPERANFPLAICLIPGDPHCDERGVELNAAGFLQNTLRIYPKGLILLSEIHRCERFETQSLECIKGR